MKILLLLLLLSLILGHSALANNDNISNPSFSDAELAQILAPIALYPDSVLSHVLIAATYPLEVVQAGRWLADHPEHDAAALADQDWDASVKALTPFPYLIARLNEDLDWMRDLGDAFLADEQRLLASVQALRVQAEQADSFDDAEHIQLSREQDNIIIEATDSKVVYIPYYDSHRVYGNWRFAGHPPHNWIGWDSHSSPFYWHSGVYLSSSFFFNVVHWSNRRIRVANHHSNYWRQHSRRHHFDRYRHRRQLLSDHSAGYWRHNPKHRRGVAYAGKRRHSNGFTDRPRHLRTGANSDLHAARAKRQPATAQRARELRQQLSGGHQRRTLQQLRAGKHRGEQQRLAQGKQAGPKQPNYKQRSYKQYGYKQYGYKQRETSTQRPGKHHNKQLQRERQQLAPSKQRDQRQLQVSTARPGKHHSQLPRPNRQAVSSNKQQRNKHWRSSPPPQAKPVTTAKAARQQRSLPGTGHHQRDLAASGQRRAAAGKATSRRTTQRPRHSPQRRARLASGHQGRR